MKIKREYYSAFEQGIKPEINKYYPALDLSDLTHSYFPAVEDFIWHPSGFFTDEQFKEITRISQAFYDEVRNNSNRIV